MANERTTKHYGVIHKMLEEIENFNEEPFNVDDPVQAITAAYQLGKDRGEEALTGLKAAIELVQLLSALDGSIPHRSKIKKSMLDRILHR